MTLEVQHRRGTTAEHATFTGAEGEITVDTSKDTVVVHDGSTVGGFPLSKETFPVGTAGAPSLRATTDTNTGVNFLGTDIISLVAGGTSRGEVTTTGLNAMAIGATTPSTISGTTGTFSGNLAVTGNVGIGTSSPAENLDVVGNIKIANGGTVYSSQNITISADPENANVASAINFNVDGTELAELNNGGYLRFNKSGFGSSGICNQQNEFALNLAGGNNAVNAGVNLAISGPSHVAVNAGFQWRDGIAVIGGWNRSGGYHYFHTGGSERMRVTSAGNVGIGTTNPGSKLSIVGLPTSASGLSAGDIWNDSGTLKIVT